MIVSNKLREALTEVFHIGVGRAASALSDLLGYEIEMNVPELYFVTMEMMIEQLEQMKGNFVCVRQKIHGDINGYGSLAFPLHNGKTLVESLLNVENTQAKFGSLEIEAIQEVGNIVINAIGAAFGDVLDLKLDYDVPEVIFIDTPLLIEPFPTVGMPYCNYAKATMGIKEIQVEGLLNLTFSYSNFEALEFFVDRDKKLSKKFGEILVEKEFITLDQLQNALDYQNQTKKFIGELLIEKGYITQAQRDLILVNPQYLQFNKRFGEILLDGNYINREQLYEVLDMQRKSRNFIGEVLVKLGFLKPEIRDQMLISQTLKLTE